MIGLRAAAAVFIFIAFSSGFSEAGDKRHWTASSSEADRTSTALTIYNSNIGLVKDSRTLTLPSGEGNLKFMNVASQIIPSTVNIKSGSAEGGLSVLEQNYEYDLLNPQKLMEKYVGKEIKLYQKNPYTEREELADAVLLSNNGGPVYRIGNDITFGHPGRVIFPGVPDDLISRPTLVWLLENGNPKAQRIEASYLTGGLNWRADYVATLGEKDDSADLHGWVTIDNKSGASYPDAEIKLVAGDVNRVREEQQFGDRALRFAETAKAGVQMREEEFFEYHIYTLPRPSTLKNNETKQIRLLEAGPVPVKKELVYRGAAHYYRGRYGEPASAEKVGVFVEMENRKQNNLGFPLPKGIVRVYKKDSDGGLQFVGEDSVNHTPVDEKFRVKLGDAFDITAVRLQTDWRKIASDTYEASYEIVLKNHKKEDVVVKVVEPIPGDWSIVESSIRHVKTEAHTAEFKVPVGKDRETRLSYRVRMRF